MRAIVYDTFGGPDVLLLREVAVPEPGPGQVLGYAILDNIVISRLSAALASIIS
jgi:hypothetical protein